jgi:hypothetical protein
VVNERPPFRLIGGAPQTPDAFGGAVRRPPAPPVSPDMLVAADVRLRTLSTAPRSSEDTSAGACSGCAGGSRLGSFVASMFRSPAGLIREIRKDVPVFAIVFVAGLAWIVTLGTQSLAEGLGIWKYFPVRSPAQVTPGAKVGFWMDLFQATKGVSMRTLLKRTFPSWGK